MKNVIVASIFSLVLTHVANAAGPLNPFVETSANTDRERLGGYEEYKEEKRIVDREREKGQIEYLEEEEKWVRNNERARIEWAKRDKDRKDVAGERKRYHEWMDDKFVEIRERDNLERKYIADKKKVRKEWKRPVPELVELDVYASRPKYEQKKRVLYGAKSSFKGINPGSSSSSSSGASFGGSSGGYQPPVTNAPMDEFGDPGYVPPPVMPDGGMDPNGDMSAIPIPPPPPPFDEGEFPAPPPPPPGFEEGDSF